ncbi:hypothetical protein [uncultured Actinomyces sp.]|uniref:hypothetical protein n=1 Tax=uncultured Actinomyces sp. TaxID=249061 RepID=UPI00288BD46A|nr:hypothetical protein [uncultured Actinomyces sp.]
MTQQNPGQPYIPPSASSGSGAYNPQQYQAQTSQYQAGGATSAASAQYQTGAQAPYQPQASFQQTGQQFAVAPPQDSFFTSLMDTSRSFVDKFGRLVFLLAVIAILVNLIYGAYNEGRSVSSLVGLGDDFNALQCLVNLLANIPWALAQIGLVRLFIELVRNTSNRGAAA